jgi:hypothetical protein
MSDCCFFLSSFLFIFLSFFLPSFLPFFLPSFLPSFLPTLLPSFLLSFLPSFFPIRHTIYLYLSFSQTDIAFNIHLSIILESRSTVPHGNQFHAQEDLQRPTSLGLKTVNSIKTLHTNFEVDIEEEEEGEVEVEVSVVRRGYCC